MSQIVEQYNVESESSPGRTYRVSLMDDQSYQCACVGWTRHVPRRDCKHILWVRLHGPMPLDPLLMAGLKVQRAEERKAAKAAERSAAI